MTRLEEKITAAAESAKSALANLRSLALTLGEKRRLTAQCEDKLRALSEALGKRGFVATR